MYKDKKAIETEKKKKIEFVCRSKSSLHYGSNISVNSG